MNVNRIYIEYLENNKFIKKININADKLFKFIGILNL